MPYRPGECHYQAEKRLHERIAQRQKELDDLQAECRKYNKEAAEAVARVEKLRKEIEQHKREAAKAVARGEELRKENEETRAHFEQAMTEFAQQIVEHEAEDGGLAFKQVLKSCEDAGESGVSVGAALEEKVKVARIEREKAGKANHAQAAEPTKERLQLDDANRRIEEPERVTKQYERQRAELEARAKELRAEFDYGIVLEAKEIAESEPGMKEGELKARVEQLIEENLAELGHHHPVGEGLKAREVAWAISAW